MLQGIKRIAIGASMALGASAIAAIPASAFSITGTDYLLYDNNFGSCGATSTCLTSDISRLDPILAGNSSAPGGNVELFASSETVSLANFLTSNARTSIVGNVGGKTLTLSSLTAEDWFGPSNFANVWFNEFYNAAGLAANEAAIKAALGLPSITPSSVLRAAAFTAFLSDDVKGFQRTSDPNISYVTTSGSDLLIGLAGHFDAKAYYAPFLGTYASFIKDGFQVSEVVKAQYGDGPAQFLYSFSATRSGLLNDSGSGNDGRSHDGNYEVALRGVVSTPVPEPSTMMGLAAIGGLFAAAKRKVLKKA